MTPNRTKNKEARTKKIKIKIKTQDPQNNLSKQRTQKPKETKSQDTTSSRLCHGWTPHN
jgi:hypothetical protein